MRGFVVLGSFELGRFVSYGEYGWESEYEPTFQVAGRQSAACQIQGRMWPVVSQFVRTIVRF